MNKEKFLVGLLILIIVLSIGSVLITSNLDFEDISTGTFSQEKKGNLGGVNLIIEKSPEKGELS